MKVYFTVLFIVTVLSGCAQRVSQPVASRPLVENVQAMASVDVPDAIASALDALPAGAIVQYSGHSLLIGEAYSAASGKLCRTLVTSVSGQRKLACKSVGQSWRYTKPVISHHAASKQITVVADDN